MFARSSEIGNLVGEHIDFATQLLCFLGNLLCWRRDHAHTRGISSTASSETSCARKHGPIAGKPVDVHLRITGKHVRLVPERGVHDTQKLVRGPEGSLDLFLHVAENPDLYGWILLRTPDVE